jgi:CDP-diacylglycerol--glycerol-3-phosphate 3-phosphatidyltransferase
MAFRASAGRESERYHAGMTLPGQQSQIPNVLTVLRLILAAAFFVALSLYTYPSTGKLWAEIAIALFIVAAITDALDGYLARKWQSITTFGRIMDPFCDKVLVIGAFIYLAGPNFAVHRADGSTFPATGVDSWMVVVIFARELLVTGIRGVVESRGIKFPAKASGKFKMVLQATAIPCILFLTVNFPPTDPAYQWSKVLVLILVWMTLVVTVWSGLPYITGMRALTSEVE